MKFSIFFAFLFVASACASYTQEARERIRLYRSGNYEAALEKLEKSPIKEQKRNRLLYHTEKASILDKLGEDKQARRHLIAADKVVDELYTTSVSAQAASFVYNESATDYEGEDFEKVAIHLVLALSFLREGDLSAARVEARAINQRLVAINQRYEKEKNRYGEDAFARLLSGMVYESKREVDSAIIDYKKSLEIYESLYTKQFYTRPPDFLVRSLVGMLRVRNRRSEIKALEKKYPKVKTQKKSGAEVVVVHEVGTIITKTTKEFLIPFGKQVIRFSFPVIKYRERRPGRTGVHLPNGDFVAADLTQNMDAIASKTLDDRRGRLILRQGARLLVKGQMTEQARQKLGPWGGIAANIYSAATETADTRSWTSLPSRYYVSRFTVPEGTQSVRIYSDGKMVRIAKINAKKNRLTILRDI